MIELNIPQITRELKIDAKAVSIPAGAAEVFIKHSLDAALPKIQRKSVITEQELKAIIAKELAKYSTDLAYVYQNRDKII